MKKICRLCLVLILSTQPVLVAFSGNDFSKTVDVSTKILGGVEAQPGAWPWMTALLYSNKQSIYQAQFCSGVLIDDTWVLTAAHCVEGMPAGDMNVAVGAYDLNAFTGSRISVKSIRIHPQYYNDNVTIRNDIALLELSQPSSVAAIPLYSGVSNDNVAPSLLGVMLTAIGWGLADGTVDWYYPSRLRQVNLPVVADSYCNDIYGDTLVASQFCAGFYAGKDVCNGDSGGPVVAKIDGVWVHAGLVSYGSNCEYYQGWYGVYTRTSEHINFITSYVPGVTVTTRKETPFQYVLPALNLLLLDDNP
ncbi:MAG: serine protease [Desulfobacterales bacterium]